MLSIIFTVLVLLGVSRLAVTQPHVVEMACDPREPHRYDDCPEGYCCVRDEFLPTWVYCKEAGNVNEDCTTRESESNCPCQQGLQCKPNIVSVGGIASLYGRCANLTTVPPPATLTSLPTTTASHSQVSGDSTSPQTARSSVPTDSTSDTTPTAHDCPHGHSCEDHGHHHHSSHGHDSGHTMEPVVG